jgi:recombination protein RecT
MENKDKKDVAKTNEQTAQVPAKREPQVFEKWAMSAKAGFLTIASEKTWNKEIIFALQIFRGNDTLQKCEPESIRNAIVNIATTGATLNPALKQAFLIPRKVNGVMQCCLDFSYRGLASLAIDTGAVLDMDSTVVHSKDKFDYEMGLEPKLIHKPFQIIEDEDGNIKVGNSGPMTYVYAIAILKNGIRKFIVLTKAEVEKVRMSSQAPNSPMWQSWYEEGARKTAIKKLYKLLPQNEKMSEAIEIINKHEGIDFDAKQESKLEERLAKDMDKTDNEPRVVTVLEVKATTGKAGIGVDGKSGVMASDIHGTSMMKNIPERVVEGVVISDAEAEAIRQREIKESRGNTVDIKKEGKLF